MPLPAPTPRTPAHTRKVTFSGFEREDGLWDIEGRITDEKTYEHPNEWRGTLKPGDHVHDMSIRLTLDHKFTILDVEAVTDASPYRMCGDITPNFARLKGIRIERGWTRQLKDIIGGPNGCTHQWELLGRVAAVAYQTTNNARQAKFPRKTGEIPRTFNTCHMYTPESSETQRRWPELYTGPKKSAAHS